MSFLAGTVAGSLGGGVIGQPHHYGLDAAVPALSVALLGDQPRKLRPSTES